MWPMVIASVVGAMMANDAAEDRQNDAQTFSASQYASRYQTQVEDMKAAGLNPMLAATQGAGSSPTGQAAPVKDVLGAGVSAALQSAQLDQVKAQTEQTKAQTSLIEDQRSNIVADTDLKGSSADSNRRNIDVMDANIKKISQETFNLTSENARIRTTVDLLAEQMHLYREQGYTQSEQQKLIRAQVVKMAKETELLKFDVDAAEAFNNLGRSGAQVKWIVDLMRVLGSMKGH